MMTKANILAVEFISPTRAAIKAGIGDGIYWRITTRWEGEQIAAQLAQKKKRLISSDNDLL